MREGGSPDRRSKKYETKTEERAGGDSREGEVLKVVRDAEGLLELVAHLGAVRVAEVAERGGNVVFRKSGERWHECRRAAGEREGERDSTGPGEREALHVLDEFRWMRHVKN